MLNAHGSAVGSVGATGLPERSPRSCFGYLPPKSIERGLCSKTLQMTAPPAMMTVNSPLMDRHSCVWLNEMLILFLQDGAHWQNKRLNSKLQLLMTRSVWQPKAGK